MDPFRSCVAGNRLNLSEVFVSVGFLRRYVYLAIMTMVISVFFFLFFVSSSSEDAEESNDGTCGKPIPPVPVNSHLHRNDSLHLNTNCGPQTLKKQK